MEAREGGADFTSGFALFEGARAAGPEISVSGGERQESWKADMILPVQDRNG